MNLLRSAATVSGFTLLSRITGLVRENLTATIFGASALTDAFFVASIKFLERPFKSRWTNNLSGMIDTFFLILGGG